MKKKEEDDKRRAEESRSKEPARQLEKEQKEEADEELEAELKAIGDVVRKTTFAPSEGEPEWSLEKANAYFLAQAQAREVLRKRSKALEEKEAKVSAFDDSNSKLG